MVIKAVIGANYGDEGKGLMTDYLCHEALKAGSCLNVLTNGGAQRGHTVVTPDGKRHVFHHFGSGTFAGADTYIPAQFISNPIIFMDEYKTLQKYGISIFNPIIFVNTNSLISTPFDMIYSRLFIENQKIHNSCGYGIYETKIRNGHHILDYIKMSDNEIKENLLNIRYEYYEKKIKENNIQLSDEWKESWYSDNLISNFISDLRDMQRIIVLVYNKNKLFDRYGTIILENAQGLLLDKDYDPEYGTSSNTGLKAVFNIIGDRTDFDIEACYVSRTYLTRHGDGKLDNETDLGFTDNTNIFNTCQGKLRYAPINYEALYERIKNDSKPYNVKTTIALTHIDEIESVKDFSYDYGSYGPCRDDIRRRNN